MLALARALTSSGTRVINVTAAVMRALSPVASPGGVVALADLIPSSVENLFDGSRSLVVAAVDVQDPGNIGALIRGAAAAGATGAATCGRSADPFSWKALRGSMGSVFRIPVAAGVDVEMVIRAARAVSARILAAHARAGRSIYELDLTGPLVVLLGSEGSGLSSDLTKMADERIAIPMKAHVESLNVAMAGAVLAFEARRQRQAASP